MNTFNELFEHLRSLSNDGIVDAATAAEYMKDNRFSYAYCVKKHGIKATQGEFALAIKAHFGTLNPQVEDALSEITKEEFLALYEFGLYSNVRQWVSKVKEQTGKYISLQDLFTWVLEAK